MQGIKGRRTPTSRRLSRRWRLKRLKRVEASWRRISVGKGPPQQSYPKGAGFESFDRRLRPSQTGSAWGGFKGTVATWSYTESRCPTGSPCDTWDGFILQMDKWREGQGTGEKWAYRVVLVEREKWEKWGWWW
ncbi:hypothetical protein DFH06DRAFT_1145362 [Mycena polygramma]|nr:hypothetical protein DFH06DRAFT_1145362 [Mycena polygramma]